MTAPNWFGWIDTRAAMRNQKQLAKHYAAEVGNDISDFDAMVLAMALDACQTDPAHKRDGREAQRQAVEIAADAEWLGSDATPKLPPANGIKSLQELADAKDHSFNRRYYGNAEGKAEWSYRR